MRRQEDEGHDDLGHDDQPGGDTMSDHDRTLPELRARIDELDDELVRVLAERLAVCREVAHVKEGLDTPVIQPDRVREVLTTRRQWAIDRGVDPDFVEEIMRVLLAETHRIEVAGGRHDAAPDKSADRVSSAIDTVVTAIDHVVVAVTDLDQAVAAFTERFGFHVVPLAGAEVPGIRAVAAGGALVVLVAPEAGPEVARYIERHGSGVQHVAIEVLNAGFARTTLAAAAAPLLTEVVVDADGHEQFFTVADPGTGLQFGFISRTGHRVGLGAANVLALFAQLDAADG